MSLLVLLCSSLSSTCKERLILLVLKVTSLVLFKNLISRNGRCARLLVLSLCKSAKHLVKKCLCHIVGVAVGSLYLAVYLIRIYTESHVGWKCPRSCCPCKEVCVLTLNLEAHDCRTLLNRLIALCNLV